MHYILQSLYLLGALGGISWAVPHTFSFETTSILDEPMNHWQLDGPVFFAYKRPPVTSNGEADLYRLFEVVNRKTDDRLYTLSKAEADSVADWDLVGTPWTYTKLDIWIYDRPGPDRVGLYRFINGQDHFFVTDPTEATSNGYTLEQSGPIGYVLSRPIRREAEQVYRFHRI